MIAVGMDLFLGDSYSQPDVPAPDDGLIAVIGRHVEAASGHSLGQRVARFVQPVAGGATDSDGEFVPHAPPPACLGPVKLKYKTQSPCPQRLRHLQLYDAGRLTTFTGSIKLFRSLILSLLRLHNLGINPLLDAVQRLCGIRCTRTYGILY